MLRTSCRCNLLLQALLGAGNQAREVLHALEEADAPEEAALRSSSCTLNVLLKGHMRTSTEKAIDVVNA